MEAPVVQDEHASQPENRRTRFPWWRAVRWTGFGLLVVLIAIQFYPYGRDHSTSSVTQAVQWDSPRTEELFNDACADCHSNATDWPWYSNIAPASWLVQSDVDVGREAFNISEPGSMEGADEAAETVQNGSMPLWYYTITHPSARLSDKEKQDLINGLIATFGGEEGKGAD